MSRTIRSIVFILAILFIATPVLAQTQAPEFRLDVNRNFGYGAGSNVRGDFSLKIYGNHESIRTVTYQMDGNSIAVLDKAPFEYRFKTDQFPSGFHELTALVETVDDRSVLTPGVRLNFLSAAQESESMKNIFIPIIAAVLGLSVIGVAVQTFFLQADAKNIAPGAPRRYGLKGGTICPRCNRPYAIHFLGLNLVIGVLDRCPFCGKWAIVRRYDPSVLAAAQQAELEAARAAESAPIRYGDQVTDDEERMRKTLEESKYLDSE